MGAFDIAVIVVLSVAFVAAVGFTVWRKIKHKGGCDCCGGCSRCGKDKEKK